MKRTVVHVMFCLLNGDLGLSKFSCMDDRHKNLRNIFQTQNIKMCIQLFELKRWKSLFIFFLLWYHDPGVELLKPFQFLLCHFGRYLGTSTGLHKTKLMKFLQCKIKPVNEIAHQLFLALQVHEELFSVVNDMVYMGVKLQLLIKYHTKEPM